MENEPAGETAGADYLGEAEVNERTWNFYRVQGEAARRAGAKKAGNPFRGKPSQYDAETAWDAGWESEDDARRRK